jgi:GNAT superfamily N-acetyltransferase
VAAQPLIRTGTADDLPVLREVFRRSALSNEGDREWIESHQDEWGLDETNVLAGMTRVAVLDGEIAGFATLVGSELEDLFVDPERMRQGIATALVLDVAATVPRIDLTANPHALAFYESVGFVEDGVADTPGGPAIRMHRDS